MGVEGGHRTGSLEGGYKSNVLELESLAQSYVPKNLEDVNLESEGIVNCRYIMLHC